MRFVDWEWWEGGTWDRVLVVSTLLPFSLARQSAVRDQYRRALLAMRARYERERDMLQARIKEMTEKHREELKRAGALPEVRRGGSVGGWGM